MQMLNAEYTALVHYIKYISIFVFDDCFDYVLYQMKFIL